jgi:dolichol-phosphate mannosyltransferase
VQLTVVIPTYNEAENLQKLVSALFSLPLQGLKILIVDDNSPDGTGQAADELAAASAGQLGVLHRPGKCGLGSAYLQGFDRVLKEGAQAVGQMDADFSHPPQMLVDLMHSLESCDVALGSRYIPGGSVDCQWPLWRKGLSGFGNLYARTFLGLQVKDATGGLRIWRRQALLGMPLERIRSNGYAFQVEMIYLASRLGYRLQETPFYFADRHQGRSKMSFRIQAEAAVSVWQMLLRYRDLHH